MRNFLENLTSEDIQHLHLAIVSVVFLNMAPSVNSMETSGGETTEVRKDGSLGKDSQTGPVSGSSLLHPQVPSFGFCSCSPVQWQNKASTVWPAAQDVGTEFALVILVQRDLHTSNLQVLAKVPTDKRGSNIKPQPTKLSSNSTFFSSV